MKYKLCRFGDVITLNNKHKVIVVRMTAKDSCSPECYFSRADGQCGKSLKELVPNLTLYVRTCDWRNTCFLPWGFCFREFKGGV